MPHRRGAGPATKAAARQVISAALDEYLESAHQARRQSGRGKPGLQYVKQLVGARLSSRPHRHGGAGFKSGMGFTASRTRERPRTVGNRGRESRQPHQSRPTQSPPPRLHRSHSALPRSSARSGSGARDNVPRFPGVDEWEMLQAYQLVKNKEANEAIQAASAAKDRMLRSTLDEQLQERAAQRAARRQMVLREGEEAERQMRIEADKRARDAAAQVARDRRVQQEMEADRERRRLAKTKAAADKAVEDKQVRALLQDLAERDDKLRRDLVQRTRQRRAAVNNGNAELLRKRQAAARRVRERELALDAQLGSTLERREQQRKREMERLYARTRGEDLSASLAQQAKLDAAARAAQRAKEQREEQAIERLRHEADVRSMLKEQEAKQKAAAVAEHMRQCLDWQVGAKRERQRRQQRHKVALRKEFQRQDAEADVILRQMRERKIKADRQYTQELWRQRQAHARRQAPMMTEAERRMNARELRIIQEDPKLRAHLLAMTASNAASPQRKRNKHVEA